MFAKDFYQGCNRNNAPLVMLNVQEWGEYFQMQFLLHEPVPCDEVESSSFAKIEHLLWLVVNSPTLVAKLTTKLIPKFPIMH